MRMATIEVRSPLAASVVAVLVEPGRTVRKGGILAIVEAMKMEHALSASRDGRVAEVMVTEGEQVEAGAPLVRLEAVDG